MKNFKVNTFNTIVNTTKQSKATTPYKTIIGDEGTIITFYSKEDYNSYITFKQDNK